MILKTDLKKIGFGGGCHWCTEAVFQAVSGVNKVEQGFITSTAFPENFSEAVIVHFDPKITSLFHLTEIHLLTHSSSSNHYLRERYRSAIYTYSKSQHLEAKKILRLIQAAQTEKIITQILPFGSFKPSPDEFKNYYLEDPEKPFCKKYIKPKLNMLKKLER